MAKHALLSASGAHRWLECTPSAQLELQFPQSTSEYAEEGTAAHELCELTARYWLGEISEAEYENQRDELAKGKYYNAEMQECANDYAKFVAEKTAAARETCEDAFTALEVRVDFSKYVKDGFGTGDCIIVSDNVLEIIDFKYGKGVRVEAAGNPQMKLYALGAYLEYNTLFDIDSVRMTIFQPRLSGVQSSDEITVKELLEWAEKYVKAKDARGNEKPLNWEHFPLIPIKYNAKEIPLIRRGRSLQDAINLLQSDFVNNMEEDVRNTVLVLKNYDGQDLGEFRRNLTTYGAIKVRTVEGTDGGVDSLEITVNAENYKTVLELLKKALIENLRSYDAKDDRLSGTPNQMNIQSMYCDIDLDANAMETELQAAFEEILWFVNTHLANTGKGSFESEDITVIFNRDILINESESIDNCAKSVGIISDETIVAMHPWVDDPAAELERLEKQKEEADPYRAAFEQANALRNPEGGEPVNEE